MIADGFLLGLPSDRVSFESFLSARGQVIWPRDSDMATVFFSYSGSLKSEVQHPLQ